MFHEADSIGSLSANGSRTGLIPPVISRVADVSIANFVVTKERTEVVGFTDALKFER